MVGYLRGAVVVLLVFLSCCLCQLLSAKDCCERRYRNHVNGSSTLDCEIGNETVYYYPQGNRPAGSDVLFICMRPLPNGRFIQSFNLSHSSISQHKILKTILLPNLNIEWISEDAFDGQAPNIVNVDLSNNSIRNVTDLVNSLRTLSNLSKLILDCNPVGVLPPEVSSLHTLKILKLVNAQLTSISASSIPLYLSRLDLDGNMDLRSVDFMLKNNLSSLEYLSVFSCGIGAFGASHAKCAPNLKYLSLGANTGLENVGSLGPGSLSHFPQLRELNLARNNMSTLSIDVFLPIFQQQSAAESKSKGYLQLRLDSNIFHCDCSMTRLNEFKDIISNMTSIGETRCSTPVSVAGEPIYDFSSSAVGGSVPSVTPSASTVRDTFTSSTTVKAGPAMQTTSTLTDPPTPTTSTLTDPPTLTNSRKLGHHSLSISFNLTYSHRPYSLNWTYGCKSTLLKLTYQRKLHTHRLIYQCESQPLKLIYHCKPHSLRLIYQCYLHSPKSDPHRKPHPLELIHQHKTTSTLTDPSTKTTPTKTDSPTQTTVARTDPLTQTNSRKLGHQSLSISFNLTHPRRPHSLNRIYRPHSLDWIYGCKPTLLKLTYQRKLHTHRLICQCESQPLKLVYHCKPHPLIYQCELQSLELDRQRKPRPLKLIHQRTTKLAITELPTQTTPTQPGLSTQTTPTQTDPPTPTIIIGAESSGKTAVTSAATDTDFYVPGDGILEIVGWTAMVCTGFFLLIFVIFKLVTWRFRYESETSQCQNSDVDPCTWARSTSDLVGHKRPVSTMNMFRHDKDWFRQMGDKWTTD